MSGCKANQPNKRRRLLPVIAALAAVLLVTGCASKRTNTGTHGLTTGSINATPGSAAARQSVARWARAYQKDRKDKSAVLGYANALSANEQITQSMAVLRAGVIAHPRDRDIASAYGKILAVNGKFPEALSVLQRAQRADTPDWKLMSAEAAILDQMGQHANARKVYKEALKIAPNEPSLLNNLGLSQLLSDQLPDAEYTLRKAASLPGADSRVRQNLALVLGLQGKYDEAIAIAQNEIDPRQAKANIAYLRQMMEQRQG